MIIEQIKINKELCDYIESLHFEVNSRKDLLAFAMSKEFINTDSSIGKPILEYSLPEVSNKLFKLLIKGNQNIDFCKILTELSMHDSMILYIKLTQ